MKISVSLRSTPIFIGLSSSHQECVLTLTIIYKGGVDLAEMKRLYGNEVALIGNVNCGLLQTGSEEECTQDVLRSLRDGMPGYGYIFSTSNCAYTGLPLERYELMNRLWREHGNYPDK